MVDWLSKIPNWWPVGVGLVILILALGETRWEIQRHVGKEAQEEADAEELQWKGIADANRRVTKLEEWVKHYEQRLSDTTFQDWVSWRAEMSLAVEDQEKRIERLEHENRMTP